MKIITVLIALGFLFTPDLSLASSRASIVATINSDMITALQLEKNVRLALLAKGVDPNKVSPGELKDIKKSVLDDLVKESILIQEAKNQNIDIYNGNFSDWKEYKDVEKEIRNSIDKAGISKEAFYADLAKQGYDEKFYKDKVKKSLLTQTLINRNVLRKIIVTNDEILEFYLANGGQITGKANVALLVYPNGEQMDMHSEKLLDNPRRFEDIAKDISVGPSANKGGVLGEMAVSDLAVPVQSAIQGLDAGEVSKVFSLNGAYAQAKVLSKTTSSDNLAEIIDPAVVAKIRDGLRMQRVGNKIEEYITGLEKKAIVTIR